MEVNGNYELRIPLLEPQDSVAVNLSPASPYGEMKIKTVTFKIKGIECASCTNSVESVLGEFEGIKTVAVSPMNGQAVVKFVPEIINFNTIREAIENAGFQVEGHPETEQEIKVCRLKIKGMACTSCSDSLERSLLVTDGVKKAVVGLALEEAKVHFDPNVSNPDQFIKVVEDAGFEANLISPDSDVNKVHLKLDGICSIEDAKAIRTALELAIGVNHVDLDIEEKKVAVSYDSDVTGPRSLIKCIREASSGSTSYDASLYVPPRQRDLDDQNEIRMYRNQFLWSCLFSIPVFVFSMILPMLPPYGDWLNYKIYNKLTIGMLLRCILCAPVQFVIGRRFYFGAYHALRRKSANMDVLVVVGTNAAYFYSLYILIKALASNKFEGQDFFETSAMLISFILLGKYLEIVAKGKTSDALAKLSELAPETACLVTIDDDGNISSETEISTQLIQRNDLFKVVPGSKVPVDGIAIDGQSYVNESMITGEAKPVAKISGDKVIGGTVNENGCIIIKATHVGSETALSQIVQLVEAAQLARAPIQKLADQISRFFVPTVSITVSIIHVVCPDDKDVEENVSLNQEDIFIVNDISEIRFKESSDPSLGGH